MSIIDENYFGDAEENPADGIIENRVKKLMKYKKPIYKLMGRAERALWMKESRETSLFLGTLHLMEPNPPRYIVEDARRRVQHLPIHEREDARNRIIREEGEFFLRFIGVEEKMATIADQIMKFVSMEVVDCKQVFKLVREMKELEIRPLMLKKHPRVVFQFRKLLVFGERLPEWIIEEDKKKAYEESKVALREEVLQVLNKFKTLYTIPPGLSFISYFRKLTAEYEEEVKSIPHKEQVLLTHDPTFYLTDAAIQQAELNSD